MWGGLENYWLSTFSVALTHYKNNYLIIGINFFDQETDCKLFS